MKQLIEDIAKALVDVPEEVAVNVIEGEQTTVLELKVAPSDLGKVIGKQGRTARSLRTILGAASMKLHHRFALDHIEPRPGDHVCATPAHFPLSCLVGLALL